MKRIGYAMCGSFCTHRHSLVQLEGLAQKYEIYPIISERVENTSTRFGESAELIKRLEEICSHGVISSVKEAERFGPDPLDALVISPCSGNTLAKIAHGITDSSVTMAAKASVRCDRPVLIALASNDALGANLCNIGTLFNRKNFYFVPLRADDTEKKPYSLICDFSRLDICLENALSGKQVLPLFCQ